MNANTFFGGIYKKPFKIFVTSSGEENKVNASPGTSKAQIHVENSHQVYEEVLSSVPESSKKPEPEPKRRKPVKKELRKFDKNRFLTACQENDMETLSTMDLSGDNDLDIVDAFGWNGLMIAACSNATDAFSFLLSRGIDYERCDKSGRSALKLAETKRNLQILEAFRAFVQQQRGTTRVLLEAGGIESLEESSFHCPICDMDFKETTRAAHSTSVLHQFNGSHPSDASYKLNYGIPEKNRGFQLMLKQGWKTRGLGPAEEGRLYPVKTVLRKPRSGLGTEQVQPGRVTHFQPNDTDAVGYRAPERGRSRQEISQDYETNRQRERRLRKALS